MEDLIYHVFPINDTKEHLLETEWKTIEFGTMTQGPHGIIDHRMMRRLICQCECNPLIKVEENGAFMVIHNSFDGREGVEWANEILK